MSNEPRREVQATLQGYVPYGWLSLLMPKASSGTIPTNCLVLIRIESVNPKPNYVYVIMGRGGKGVDKTAPSATTSAASLFFIHQGSHLPRVFEDPQADKDLLKLTYAIIYTLARRKKRTKKV